MNDPMILAVVWNDRDDKVYFYGPFNNEAEECLGRLWLEDLWSDKLARGAVTIHSHGLGLPPWVTGRMWGPS